MQAEAIGITAVGFYAPERVMNNHEFPAELETSHDWIVSHTGIHQRHLADSQQASSDLAEEACRRALEQAKLQAGDIDLIIVATSTPDYNGFPSTACILQDKLGCHGTTAFDLSAACSGFVYILEVARNMMLSNPDYRRALLVGTEVFSSIINWKDRGTCILFGDGAGAVVMEKNNQGSQIIDSVLKANGLGLKDLYVPEGGSRSPVQAVQDRDAPLRNKVEMNGRAVYDFAVKANQEIINELLSRNNLHIDDIDCIVPHQANERIIKAVAKRENIPMERFFLNIKTYANTSAASIPIALGEMLAQNKLKKGDLILTIGFGAGLTYGGNLIRW